MSCSCAEPVENINPRHRGLCVKCSQRIVEPEWASSDANLGQFFDRLAEAMFPAYGRTLDRRNIPRWFYEFYRHCSHREKAGRKKFGYRYLNYDNTEYQEEMADGSNYAFFRLLQDRREGRGDERIATRLSQARNAALGWKDAYEDTHNVKHWFSDTEQ